MSEDNGTSRSQGAAGGEQGGDSPEARMARLEGRTAELEQQLLARQQELDKRNADLKGLSEQVSAGAAKYRGLLLAGNPEVPQELVAGKTIAEVEASFQSAKEMVGRIKRQLEAKMASERVPTGAPARGAPDLSQLSPREKIAHALSQR